MGLPGRTGLKIEKPRRQCICVDAPPPHVFSVLAPAQRSFHAGHSPALPGQMCVRHTLSQPAKSNSRTRLGTRRETGAKIEIRNVQLAGKETKRQHRAQRVTMMHVVIGFYPREGRYFGTHNIYSQDRLKPSTHKIHPRYRLTTLVHNSDSHR